MTEDNAGPGGAIGSWIRIFLRFMQLVLALTVCGLYGSDLHAASTHGAKSNSGWLYAVVVGAITAVTCLVYFAPIVKSWVLWPWDLILFLLWTAVFGHFATIFLHANPADFKAGQGPSYTPMHNAVWVDLTCMLLWFSTGMMGFGTFLFYRHRRTSRAGRAEV